MLVRSTTSRMASRTSELNLTGGTTLASRNPSGATREPRRGPGAGRGGAGDRLDQGGRAFQPVVVSVIFMTYLLIKLLLIALEGEHP
jgi:hypothetical protein